MARLQDVIVAGSKKHGSTCFLKANSAPRDFPRIPTGIFPLDFAIGGGVPSGQTASFWGPPSTAKTYIGQRIVVHSNNICHRCYCYFIDCQCKDGPLVLKSLYIDAEGSFDWAWAEDIGVPEDLDIVYGLSGEEYVDIYHSAIRATDVGLIIIDSIADLVPEVELEGSAGDTFVMSQARLVSYMIRKGKTLLMKERRKGHNVAVVMLNQIRAKIGGPGGKGPSEEVPGGNASKHDFALAARTGRRTVKDMDSAGLPEHSTISISMGNTTSKKKLLVLAGAAQFNVVTSHEHEFKRGTVLDYNVVMKYALEKGILRKNGSKYALLLTAGAVEFPTQKSVIAAWQEDDVLYWRTQRSILDEAKEEIIGPDM